jgi:hypothetical protein
MVPKSYNSNQQMDLDVRLPALEECSNIDFSTDKKRQGYLN